jgi:Helix-turn-helix of DDE superfamily endonuclease
MPRVLQPTTFYQQYKSYNPKNFQRLLGLKPHQFDFLFELFSEYVDKHWEKRGRKGSFQLVDKLILTLRYLRSYPTFLELGVEFGIGHSFAHSIFTEVSETLVKILKLPNLNQSTIQDLGTVILDVSEQEVERPKKNKS